MSDALLRMIGVERLILQEIKVGVTRDDVALTYAFGLRDERGLVDWKKVNRAIIARWSISALQYIKQRAWARKEKL